MKLWVAERALILIEVVLAAPEALWIFEFRVAQETAVFITVVLSAPQPPGLP